VTFCSDKVIFGNLCLMAVMWSVASMNYYVISFFLKYIPGNIYVNTSISSISEIVAYICSGFVLKIFGIKYSFLLSYVLAAIGGAFMVFFSTAGGNWTAFFVLFAKFGISFAFNIAYLSTPLLFPTRLCSTAFGICNVFARFATILAPIIAELKTPVPMLIYSISSVVAGVLCLFITNVRYE